MAQKHLNLFETWSVVKKQRVESSLSICTNTFLRSYMYQYLPDTAEIIEINEDSDSDNDEENELCEGQGYNNASVTQSTDVVCDKKCGSTS